MIDDKYLAGNFLARDELLIHILSWDIAVCMTGMLQHYTVIPSLPVVRWWKFQAVQSPLFHILF